MKMKNLMLIGLLAGVISFGAVPYTNWSNNNVCQQITYLELNTQYSPFLVKVSFDPMSVSVAHYYQFDNVTGSADAVKAAYATLLSAKQSGTPVCVLINPAETGFSRYFGNVALISP